MKHALKIFFLITCSIQRLIKKIPFVVILLLLGLIRVNAQTVTDIEGNVYNTVSIGTQVWMAENLKTTKYNDGAELPNVTDNTAWKSLITGAYCDFGNDPAFSTTNGRLYNWYAVDNDAASKVTSNGGKNVCPISWHVPADAEWTTLTDYLIANGYNWDGTTTGNKIAKSMASSSGWVSNPTAGNIGNDQASNNRSGFTALPGSYREDGIFFGSFGQIGYWWSSTGRYFRVMQCNYSNVQRSTAIATIGYSVRCLKDELLADITNPLHSTIEIYPNPVSGILNIDYKSENSETVSILNSQGLLLKKEKAITLRQQLDFSKYVPGLYFLEFAKASGEIKRLKVVKH
jgi:uncharacterized protein (TIGR02145 family)